MTEWRLDYVMVVMAQYIRDPLAQEQNLSVCHNAVFRSQFLGLRTPKVHVS